MQFVWEIIEGEAKEEIWSSVNYLVFISASLVYGKKRQIRQGIVWLKNLKGVFGLEMSRAWEVPGLKVSYNIALLKWQENGLPAEGGFL